MSDINKAVKNIRFKGGTDLNNLKFGVTLDDTNFKLWKQEISRKVSLANKRLRRLEENNLTDQPAYRTWKNYNGGEYFSVKGKNFNELQAENARLNNFINSTTSTVRGANAQLKEVAERFDLKYSSVKDLPLITKRYFELTSKAGQYLQNVEGSLSAITSDQQFEIVSDYVKQAKIDLAASDFDMETALDDIIKLSSYDEREQGGEFDAWGYVDM